MPICSYLNEVSISIRINTCVLRFYGYNYCIHSNGYTSYT